MFGAPECIKTENGVKYFVKLQAETMIGAKYEMNENSDILPDISHQERLQIVKIAILTELAKHEQLFKNRPKLESLVTITPNWGCILSEGTVQWSPHTEISANVDISKENLPCYVDLRLEGLYISRSTITPLFKSSFLEKKLKQTTIDFDWNPISPPEVEEVSDISVTEEGVLKLRDPIAMLKAKHEAKEAIKMAFRRVSELHMDAVKQAKRFMNEYDISENESVFSEWMDNGESGSEDNL